MFEFSTQFHHIHELTPWLNHFKKISRPAGIVAYHGKLTVWRSGLGVRGSEEDTEEYSEEPVGRLIKWVNGFDREWPETKIGAAKEERAW